MQQHKSNQHNGRTAKHCMQRTKECSGFNKIHKKRRAIIMIYKNLICSGANFRLSAMQAFKQNKSIDVTTAQRTIALSCCCSSYSSSSQCRLIGWWRARLADCVEIFVRACARLIIVISIRHSMRSMPSAAINSGAMRQLSTLLN